MPYFQTSAYRLHYQWGAAFNPKLPTVILLHDGLGAIASWRTLPQQIARALNVNTLAYDRHGYGRSQPREAFGARFMEAEVAPLLELADHLELARPFLVGHSDGGSIALLYAARHPGRVGAVVTEAAHAFVGPETQQGIRRLVSRQPAGKTPSWPYHVRGGGGDYVLRAWSDQWLGGVHARWNMLDQLEGVGCPLLVIQGDGDEFGTQAQVDSITSRVAGAKSWIVPGCGHTPHSQVEAAFLERLTGFFAPLLPG